MAVPRSWCAAGVLVTLAATCFGPAGAETPRPDAGPPETVRLLDVPYVPQTEALCGGAAIAMVLRYWGERAVLAEDFAALVEPGGSGIRADALVAAVRARGWTALPLTGTPAIVTDQLARGRPVVALLDAGAGTYHYVVLAAWANRGVILHDPAVAPFRAMSEQAFDEAWARSGRWALLVLPPERVPEAAVPDSANAGAAMRTATPAPRPTPATIAGCDAIVEDAIQRARSGDLAEAERRLLSAEALCPESAAPLRGLAGLRFKAEDWAGAARFAERALARDPEDPYTWRLLAGSRFLAGDEEGALRAWNRVSEPRADLARVDGLARIRYDVVADQLGLPPGRVLTSRALVRARRRLAEVPASSEGRLSLRPLPQGSAQVDVALLERPLLFDGPLDAGGTGLRALIVREASLQAGSPTGHGEMWTAGASWRRERPSASLELAVPAPGRPGIWRVEGRWERQAYAVEATPGAGDSAGSTVTREERRRTALSFSDWIDSNLRLEVGAALDRWSGRGAHVSLDGTMEALFFDDRLALRAEATQWTSLDRTAPFEAGGIEAQWSTKRRERRGGWLLRAGASSAATNAPLALWPGAGTGRGRAHLLRAHPLLDDGIVAGRAFGRTLLHAGLERQEWIYTVEPLRLGLDLFVDGARPRNTLRSEEVPWQVDAGAGIRLAGLGSRSEFRISAAHGLVDGESAVSVAWEVR